ncbi:MAG: alpha/beta fold hydrolase [Flavobacteriales bacterium]|jgi:pimeloyl-ACP methyl ester carboxylesterase
MNASLPLHHETHLCDNPNADWVLMVHGAGGSTRTWKKQHDEFSKHYHVLLIDLPGHAGSATKTKDQDRYDFHWISARIWEVVDYYTTKPIHVVAVSLGSIVGMQMYEQRPAGVSSLLFAGPIVSLNVKLRLLASTGLFIARIIGFRNFYSLMAKVVLPRKNHRKSREIFVRESKFLSIDEYRKWTAMYGKHLDQTLRNLFNFEPQIPVLLLVGGQDHLFLKPTMQYASRFQNISIEVVQRCGHLVSLERADEFNRRCLDFLRKF